MLALRSIARRVLQLTAEERELAAEIEKITRKLATIRSSVLSSC